MMPLGIRENPFFPSPWILRARMTGEALVSRGEDGGMSAALEFAGLPPHSAIRFPSGLEKFDDPILPEPEP